MTLEAIDVPLEVASRHELRQRKLLKAGDRAREEAQLAAVETHEGVGQHHVGNAYGGYKCLGECVQIDDAITVILREQGRTQACAKGELAIVVILDEVAPRVCRQPGEQLLAAGV